MVYYSPHIDWVVSHPKKKNNQPTRGPKFVAHIIGTHKTYMFPSLDPCYLRTTWVTLIQMSIFDQTYFNQSYQKKHIPPHKQKL